MTATTATLVHRSDSRDANALRIARVAAGSRVQRQRIAAEYRRTVENARRESVVATYLADAERAGAVAIGFKICTDYGKIRMRETFAEARGTLVHYFHDDMEAWGITATGDYVAIW
jgi:hypothetical protein